MKIASFDIGTRNFACCIANINWPNDPTPESVEENISFETLFLIDLSSSKNDSITDYCSALTKHLEEHKHIYLSCQVILIEKQMCFKGMFNIRALRIAQHCMSWFVIQQCANNELVFDIVEFPAANKTKRLGAIDLKTKPERKKWCILKAEQLLQSNKTLLSKFQKTKKKDDIADTVCQATAFAIMCTTVSTMAHYLQM
jgi:hypothetical protein